MNIFMVWYTTTGMTCYYTVYSEDLEEFYCELFNYSHTEYPPTKAFRVKKTSQSGKPGWMLEGDCRYQKEIARAIEKRLETDKDLRKY